MKIVVSQAGKRYNRDWIFRRLDYEFTSDKKYAITGNNGSGKSTLLQCLSGSTLLNEGTCQWTLQDGKTVDAKSDENIFRQFSFAAPYLDIIEEMTVREFLEFHHQFKPLLSTLSIDDMIHEIQLEGTGKKQIRHFSSGMKQRIKLAQAIFSDAPVLFLDEPCSNLDKEGFELYNHLIDIYSGDKLIIVSSNDPQEYTFCTDILDIRNYKPSLKTV